MNDDKMNTVQIPADKLVDALLHAKQFEHHYATQESVDNLKESMAQRFEQVDKQIEQRFEQVDQRFEQVDKRFEQVDKQITELKGDVDKQFERVNNKVDRLQWFIIASALVVIFKEHIFALFT